MFRKPCLSYVFVILLLLFILACMIIIIIIIIIVIFYMLIRFCPVIIFLLVPFASTKKLQHRPIWILRRKMLVGIMVVFTAAITAIARAGRSRAVTVVIRHDTMQETVDNHTV